tara:strand:+ start:593 stop:1480 length:888 start_codon:yes stop_codon:yes gene_type:complete
MAVDTDTVRGFYQQYLDRDPGANQNVQNWANSGLSAAEIETAIANSEEGKIVAARRALEESQQQDAQGQQAGATTSVSRERLTQLYNELFGRDPLDAGAEYWMASGLTGEKLRNALIAGAQGSDRTDFQERQAMIAAGQRPPGYAGSPLDDSTTETVPAYFQDYLEQYNAMQERLNALTALIEQMQSQSSSTPAVGTPPIGQPGQNVPVPVPSSPAVDPAGTYSYNPEPISNPYLAQLPSNPPVGYVPPTPEMLDAYRYQQFYNQGLVPPIDQGIGQLSYFGIPPSQIQASLSGF